MASARTVPSGQTITAADPARGLCQDPSRYTHSQLFACGCSTAFRTLTHPHETSADTCGNGISSGYRKRWPSELDPTCVDLYGMA